MVKRFSHVVSCLLLVLMPLQALAAANMIVCHGVMQTNALETNVTAQSAKAMSCYQMQRNADESKSSAGQHLLCKAHCAAMCANVCALTVSMQAHFPESLPTTIDVYHVNYTSIAQQRLQRPPISFI